MRPLSHSPTGLVLSSLSLSLSLSLSRSWCAVLCGCVAVWRCGVLCIADSLHSYFSRFGAVSSATVAKNRETGRNRGYGFVKFADPSVVDSVLSRAAAQPFLIDGARVDIRRARPAAFSQQQQQQQQASAAAWHSSSPHSALSQPAAAALFYHSVRYHGCVRCCLSCTWQRLSSSRRRDERSAGRV